MGEGREAGRTEMEGHEMERDTGEDEKGGKEEIEGGFFC
jgi:hypothetical protein